jgi:hypothetical protein
LFFADPAIYPAEPPSLQHKLLFSTRLFRRGLTFLIAIKSALENAVQPEKNRTELTLWQHGERTAN